LQGFSKLKNALISLLFILIVTEFETVEPLLTSLLIH
jgi:hypothetical protein